MGTLKHNTILRYTSFSSLVDMLTHKRITLLPPSSWDDKNDVHFMERYKDRVSAKSVYGLCFSDADQSYHHWRVFAGGDAGVCISFRRDRLERAFRGNPKIEFEPVKYVNVKEARSMQPLEDHDLKFLKHKRYKDEKEIRAVYTSPTNDPLPRVPIKLDDISRVTLSPWLNKSLAENLKQLLKKVDGCEHLKIYRSTLIDFSEWRSMAADS